MVGRKQEFSTIDGLDNVLGDISLDARRIWLAGSRVFSSQYDLASHSGTRVDGKS